MLANMEYEYFKPAAGVPAEMTNHVPSLDYERNKICTSITVIVGITRYNETRSTLIVQRFPLIATVLSHIALNKQIFCIPSVVVF